MNALRVVGLVVDNSPEFIRTVLACWEQKAVVVALRSPQDQARIGASGATEIRTVTSGSGWLQQTYIPSREDAPAQMLFTSGTEGEPKCVVLTHANLADVVQRLNSVMQVTSEIREYVGVPVYHSFGFGRCRAVLAVGGAAYIPAHGFNPVEIHAMLERGEINAISAVPSLWRILLQSRPLSVQAAARVRWIEIGSQFLGADEKVALRELFPNAVIVQHYGLTEASRSTFLEVHRASPAELESVGRALGDVEVAISSSGRILVRGPHVSTRMGTHVGFQDPRDPEGWLTTNDLGALRDGYLHYLGRADDMINCGGLKLSPDDMERALYAQLGPLDGLELAVCKVPDALRGDGILLVASATAVTDEALLKAVRHCAVERGLNAGDAIHLMRVDRLERTETGKVMRQAMAQAYCARSRLAPAASTHVHDESLRGRLGRVLGVQSIADDDTFVDLGGDSLRYIQASMELEALLGYLPEGWEQTPVAALEALQPKRSTRSDIEPSVILRAMAIVSVVMNHAGVFKGYFAIDGAAMMLLMPAGYSFARFQLQRVLHTNRAVLALASLPRVMVPAVLLLGLQQLRHHVFQPSALLLYENFLNTPGVFGYWFVDVFVQIHLLLALLLMVPAFRDAVRRKPWSSSVAALMFSALLGDGMELVWNTEPLFHLVPQWVIWYFFMGWCFLFARQVWQRWLNTVMLLVLSLRFASGAGLWSVQTLWFLAGGCFLNWAPTIRLPSALVRFISAIASASLYVYISHFLVHEPFRQLFPWLSDFARSFVEIAAGMVFWKAFEGAWQRCARIASRCF